MLSPGGRGRCTRVNSALSSSGSSGGWGSRLLWPRSSRSGSFLPPPPPPRGGNQQKVLLARWLCLNPELLLLDEPTRGIDVGAKAEIQRLIDELSARGGWGWLLISSELEEISEGADRVVVLREGRSSPNSVTNRPARMRWCTPWLKLRRRLNRVAVSGVGS